jgi:short-subunit dehydrogenase
MNFCMTGVSSMSFPFFLLLQNIKKAGCFVKLKMIMSPGEETMSSKETAVVTGASFGIGRDLAEICAREGHDLVLVARTQEKLESVREELERRFAVSSRVYAMDLTESAAPNELCAALEKKGIEVELLVNNAGFGSAGPFVEADLQLQLDMIQLNIKALTHLSRLLLPPMVERGRGRILNVASVAGFQPGPFMAVYYASKAFVLSFSEAMAEEVRGKGVTVTALCPGPTATEFQARAKMESSRLRRLGLMSSRAVAEQGYRGMMGGRTVVVAGLMNRLLVQSLRLSPRFVVRKVAKWLNTLESF